ncbi:hypothetical protein QYF61_000405 [Mycteria americana]|uniref:Uncharacterized protein n=1 Tax=Mycteria americana TaxID=33587 RepID=A0AAN7MHX1_MYCAM|nr:hypothetical protein QYF61_000405 [Mycteria americana]
MLTLLSRGEVAHNWPQAGCQWSTLPPGLTAKGEAWKLQLYSNYLVLSSLFQAPAGESGTGNSRRETPYSPSNQQTPAAPRPAHLSGRETRFASINFITSQDDSKSQTKPGVIQPFSRVRQNAASHNSEDGDSPNPFQQPELCFNIQNSQKPPSPPSPDDIPINVKQAYKTFAAVPLSHPLLETQVTSAGWGGCYTNSGTNRRLSIAGECVELLGFLLCEQQ